MHLLLLLDTHTYVEGSRLKGKGGGISFLGMENPIAEEPAPPEYTGTEQEHTEQEHTEQEHTEPEQSDSEQTDSEPEPDDPAPPEYTEEPEPIKPKTPVLEIEIGKRDYGKEETLSCPLNSQSLRTTLLSRTTEPAPRGSPTQESPPKNHHDLHLSRTTKIILLAHILLALLVFIMFTYVVIVKK